MGFVIAGGKSSRMGELGDKTFLQFDGQTLLHRALTTLEAVSDRVAIVGDPAKFGEKFGEKSGEKSGESAAEKCQSIVADIFPGCGPLGGIHAALRYSPADLNLMLAVDMPFVSRALLAFLFATAQGNHATITVPRVGNRLQPLCAVYRRQFAAVAERSLRAGNYKLDAAFSDVPTYLIEAEELAAAGFSENVFFNVNTPQDRRTAEERSF